MANTLDSYFGIHARALGIRSARAQILAENLANADTPQYKSRDIDFQAALSEAMNSTGNGADGLRTTHAAHIGSAPTDALSPELFYRAPRQDSLDGNTVDGEVEKGEFMRNAVQYQTSLQLLDGKIRSLLAAIRGE
jgi:flagellar basal-body rod protein FlgB